MDIGIQCFLNFGDICYIYFRDMGYFFKIIKGIWARASLLDLWLRMAMLTPSPLGNFADISNLVKNFQLHSLRDAFTLYTGVLVSDILLYMLPYQIWKNKKKCLSYRKKALSCLII